MFHSRCGSCVVLLNNGKTASRANPTQEFNHGLVFSCEPLKNNEVFEVKIDKKLNTWSGSIEIGVTVCNPDVIDIPITATDLKGGTWVMLGQGVFRDGQSLHEAYGCDLDKLVEGDRVGVMKNSQGELLFYVNGECQGVASRNIPPIVYAVVDLYGKCAEITVTSPSTPDSNPLDDDSVEEALDSLRENSALDASDNQLASAVLESGPLAPTASNDASLTDTGSALAAPITHHHITNIDIANSILSSNISGHDSNLLEEERDTCDARASSAFDNASVDNGSVFEPRSDVVQRRIHDAENAAASLATDRLRFHEKTGLLVLLSAAGRTAERKRPRDEFNHGVVMSNRALRVNELFEIRIESLVDKWSGSIEVGITTHNPSHLEFPATMTSMRSGTIMMSGTAILSNGKGTLREYGSFNLDELKETDRIGMMINEYRDLHYYINGLEQGIAASNVPYPVWAVVDLYGMTVKVSIVDCQEESLEGAFGLNSLQNNDIATVNGISEYNDLEDSYGHHTNDNRNPLLFHMLCGSFAQVINGGKTAHRPNPSDDFNNGVVLTNRCLLPGEIFEVRLDSLVNKWAGSLEIGVTTHSPYDLEFPSTMTNIRSGTWLMTSCNITHNGTIILEYGMNLDRLRIGDRVGVCRKRSGALHFYINGTDRGVAACNVPENVFGVVDLYGRASQVTLCYPGQPNTLSSCEVHGSSVTSSTVYSDLRFHHLHGQNVRVVRSGLAAQRPNADSEFNDAIVMTNRPLKDGEMFEVMIERMVGRWSGSLEAGMTAIAPEHIDFPSTMTDIDYDTWMLSGSSVMRNGGIVINNYACDLDMLDVGTRIGMMRHTDGTLHYYVNGEDQGVACSNLKSGLWGVIDLYGQCAQVSIVHNPVHSDNSVQSNAPYLEISRLSLTNGAPQRCALEAEMLHRWSKCCGANIVLSQDQVTATRVRHFNHGLVFSSQPIEVDELFEVRLEKVRRCFSGSIRIGLTSLPIGDSFPAGNIPSSLTAIESADTWWVEESSVRKNGSSALRLNYCPNLGRLQAGDRIGVKRTLDRALKVYINGIDCGSAATNVSKRVFAVVELFGSAESISICSLSSAPTPVVEGATGPVLVGVSQDSLELNHSGVRVNEVKDHPRDLEAEVTQEERPNLSLESTFENSPSESPVEMKLFENRGRNIELSADRTAAKRVESYNQGIVFSAKPLTRGSLFQVKLGALHPRWSSSLKIGVTTESPDQLALPNTAFDLKRNTWLISADSVFYNGVKIKGRYGPNLDSLSSSGGGSHLIGVLVDFESRLHLYVNGVDQGVAGKEIPFNPYCVIDLYGQCQEVFVCNNGSVHGHDSQSLVPESRPSLVSETSENSQQRKGFRNSHSIHHHRNLQQQLHLSLHSSTQVHSTTSVYSNQLAHPNSGVSPRSLSREEQTNNDLNANRRFRSGSQSDHIKQSQDSVKDKCKDVSDAGVEGALIKNCEYQNLCARFRFSLALPDAYFSREGDMCFCETCHKIRGDESFHTKGNPPKRYAVPIGWCRFSLVTSVGENNESWHMAYHGVRGGSVRRVLDKGELLFEGELGVNIRLPESKSKEDSSDGSLLQFSPSITFASRDIFAPHVSFVDQDTRRHLKVKMVLQVAVEPGSYKVLPSDQPNPQVDSSILENDSTQWQTKERGATQLLALLIKVESK